MEVFHTDLTAEKQLTLPQLSGFKAIGMPNQTMLGKDLIRSYHFVWSG